MTKFTKLCLTLIMSSFFLAPMASAMTGEEDPTSVPIKPKIEDRLKELGITLSPPLTPGGKYVPFKKKGSSVRISGQISLWDGKVHHAGKLGRDLKVEDGQKAARICVLNILAHLKTACGGDLDLVKECDHLHVVVNSTDDFKDHSQVANGASDFIEDIFGEKGRHTRVAIGANSLPRGASVEIEALFEVKDKSERP